MEQIKVYVINHFNEERRDRMESRAKILNIEFEFLEGCSPNDERTFKNDKIISSSTIAHMEAVKKFVETDYEYCIICEDDIHIRRSFFTDMEEILLDFQKMKLDVLLLGYLFPFKIFPNPNYFPFKKTYNYFDYPSDLWGAQMYLITRKYGEFLVNSFENDVTNFITNADWNITKLGNKALIYPMMAVEEGECFSEDYYQLKFHKDNHIVHYDKDFYI